MRLLAILTLVILVFAGAARAARADDVPGAARPEVLVLGTASEPARQRLVDFIAIELAPSATVRAGWQLSEPTFAGRVDEATREVLTRGTDWVTWAEVGPRSATGESTVVLVVVGRRDQHPVVEVRRTEAREEDDLDRALAIKVAEVLDVVLRRAASPAATPAPIAAVKAVAAPPASDGPRLAVALEVGARGATPSGSTQAQVLAALGAGGSATWDDIVLELLVNVRGGSGFEAQTERGTITTREIALGGEGRVMLRRAPLRIGAFSEIGARLIEGEGVTRAGTEASALRSVPTLSGGAELQLEAASWLAVRMALGIEGMLRRQQYAIDDVPMLDVGKVRGFAHLGAAFTVP